MTLREWYYYVGDKWIGPFTDKGLKVLADDGIVLPETHLMLNGKVVLAEKVAGLFPAGGSKSVDAPDHPSSDIGARKPLSAMLDCSYHYNRDVPEFYPNGLVKLALHENGLVIYKMAPFFEHELGVSILAADIRKMDVSRLSPGPYLPWYIYSFAAMFVFAAVGAIIGIVGGPWGAAVGSGIGTFVGLIAGFVASGVSSNCYLSLVHYHPAADKVVGLVFLLTKYETRKTIEAFSNDCHKALSRKKQT